MEETADTIYLVLPSASRVGQGGEISDEALESVSGGEDTVIRSSRPPPMVRSVIQE